MEQLCHSEAPAPGGEVSEMEQRRMARAMSLHGRLLRCKFQNKNEAASHRELLQYLEPLKKASGVFPETPGLEGTGHPDDNWSALHRRFRVQGRIGWKEGDCPTGGYDLDKALIRATKRMSADYLLAHATDAFHGGGLSFERPPGPWAMRIRLISATRSCCQRMHRLNSWP